jgi:hypothetical protein
MWDKKYPEVCCDYCNYYSWPGMRDLALGVGAAAIFANSDLDGEIQSWYQNHIRNRVTNSISSIVKPFGQGQYTIPLAVGFSLLDDTGWFDESPVMHTVCTWGSLVSRAYLVGGPPMLVMQELTGGSRPSSSDSHSGWRPFSASNGVSGDAFMSTCMFISAANMTDDIALKCGFYAVSFLVPMERINYNQHFFSQAALGWWMGYLACRAVNNTELAQRNLQVVPLFSPEMTGVGLIYTH